MRRSQPVKYQPAQSTISYRKKARSLQVKYGVWQIELRTVCRGHFGDSQWARLVENRRVSFSLQFREDFEKDPHVRPVYRSIFQSREPIPSFSGFTRGRATGEIGAHVREEERRRTSERWRVSERREREREKERLREKGKRERDRVNLASKFLHQFWSPSSVSPTRCN